MIMVPDLRGKQHTPNVSPQESLFLGLSTETLDPRSAWQDSDGTGRARVHDAGLSSGDSGLFLAVGARTGKSCDHCHSYCFSYTALTFRTCP